MKRLLAFLCLLPLAVPAPAAERNYSVGNFDRLRIYGPYRIVLTTGQPPSAVAEGDARATDLLDMRVEGDTLTVRAGPNAWGEQPASTGGTPVIRLSTRTLRGVMLIGSGDLTIVGPVRGQKIDLALSGSGALRADAIDADQFSATTTGSGRMTLAGRAAKARLSNNGPGGMQAGGLVAGDLALSADGGGDMVAQAKFTATVAARGIGAVTVYGAPACTLRGTPNGPVTCGAALPPTP
ncbi:head GIN domain-containing protein [Sphingomonas sp. PB4P5]|uniref:head GIN domain-containing protein n=1 Tax=Parasphingomonas puruogangriensis TaxID=3096155 RepID=UPI002FC9F5A6